MKFKIMESYQKATKYSNVILKMFNKKFMIKKPPN